MSLPLETPSILESVSNVEQPHDSSMPNVLTEYGGGSSPSAPVRDGPIPMSMPAILRNPRISHTQPSSRQTRDGFFRPSASVSPNAKHVGKRRARRSENSRFASNPHTVRPCPKDYTVPANEVRSTFAGPNLETLSMVTGNKGDVVADVLLPGHDVATFEMTSALQGQFTLSLRDAQQYLRLRLGRAYSSEVFSDMFEAMSISQDASAPTKAPLTFVEQLIGTAQREIQAWLRQMVHIQTGNSGVLPRVLLSHADGTGKDAIVELRRSPTCLVWRVDDGYARMAVHCVARTLDCPSFSRTESLSSTENARLTWIMHPNPLLRGTRAQRAWTQRPRHRRSSSASTTASMASSVASSTAYTRPPRPLTAGLLQQGVAGLDTPPSTDLELTDSNDEFIDSDLASEVEW